jgi:hypothetical protein
MQVLDDHQAAAVGSANHKMNSKKSSLSVFTSSSKKSMKGSNDVTGWNYKGKQHVIKTYTEIKQDEQLGIWKKWEEL